MQFQFKKWMCWYPISQNPHDDQPPIIYQAMDLKKKKGSPPVPTVTVPIQFQIKNGVASCSGAEVNPITEQERNQVGMNVTFAINRFDALNPKSDFIPDNADFSAISVIVQPISISQVQKSSPKVISSSSSFVNSNSIIDPIQPTLDSDYINSIQSSWTSSASQIAQLSNPVSFSYTLGDYSNSFKNIWGRQNLVVGDYKYKGTCPQLLRVLPNETVVTSVEYTQYRFDLIASYQISYSGDVVFSMGSKTLSVDINTLIKPTVYNVSQTIRYNQISQPIGSVNISGSSVKATVTTFPLGEITKL